MLAVLREYAKEFKPDKRGYLFEGSIKGQPYSVRSLQEVLQSAKRHAGVLKPLVACMLAAQFCHTFGGKRYRCDHDTEIIGA